MAATGLRQIVLTVRWSPALPALIPDVEGLDRAVVAAEARGLAVVLAVYPYPPAELALGLGTPRAFASWLRRLATRYPSVGQYVVMNEPNQPAFLRPQFRAGGLNASAARTGAFLAAAYDALNQVDPTIEVVGLGLSPRGNDRPSARSNISTSPIRFLRALGDWYRASGRTEPIMDGLSFHPYPNVATDPLDRGYPWPNAGFVDLGRVKQAIWDAFHDTAQPTTLDGLALYLDEVGWQVETLHDTAYVGTENVRVTDEKAQAWVYAELVRRATCDPDIAQVNIFGFYDDRERSGFQAALHRADGTPRLAARSVRRALAGAGCTRRASARWRPALGVVGARVPRAQRLERVVRLEAFADEGAVALACAFPGRLPATAVKARLAAASVHSSGCTATGVRPNRAARFDLPRPPERLVSVGVRLVAEANAARVTMYAR